jgi:anti-sigma factor RsiW
MSRCVVFEEMVNGYADGELDEAQHARLFAHLATCGACRELLENVVHFRRLIRDERIIVPPKSDIDLFQRVASLRASSEVSQRMHERDPVWSARKTISTRTALAVTSAVFFFGLVFGNITADEASYSVSGTQEGVQIEEGAQTSDNAVYVFYPGLIIEAERAEP